MPVSHTESFPLVGSSVYGMNRVVLFLEVVWRF